MENTLVKVMPTQEVPDEVKEHMAAIVESEFDLDIRVFTPILGQDKKEPQAFFTLFSCGYCSNSCVTCFATSCFTCGC